MRRHIRNLLCSIVLVAVILAVSAIACAGDWTQDGHDAQRTGYTSESPTGTWTYAWGWNGPNSSTGTTNQHLYNAPREARIVTGGNYVFCPAGSSGLYAINKSNGAQAWRFTTATVNATPAYDAATGMLYVPGANGTLYKLNTANSGSVSGSYSAGNAINKSVLLVGSYAYVVTDDGHLHKVTTSSMASAWGSSYAASSNTDTPPSYSSSRDCIVFATQDLYVHAVNNSGGTQKWRVKPTAHTAGYPYEYKYSWPVMAEQHGVVFIRMNLSRDDLALVASGNKYPTTNSAIRTFLTDNPGIQNLFALNLDDGTKKFIPAVGPGAVENYVGGVTSTVMGTMPVVKVLPSGQEVVYMIWRNGQVYDQGYDYRWDSHMGEMVLDNTTVSGYVAGDLRFVDFTGVKLLTDEQCPVTMAGDTIFHAHWGFGEQVTITNRGDTLGGAYTTPIQSTQISSLCRALSSGGTPNTTTHWHTGGLTLYNDGRYQDGPGWWAYWNIVDPPGSPVEGSYSAGFLPRYSLVADGLVLLEGNGGDITALRFAPGGGGDSTAPGNISNLSAPSSTSNSVTLNWTAPGDDGATGTASTYDIRRSTSTITAGNWDSATAVTGEPTPQVSGTAQSMTVSGLNPSTTYYFAMKTADEVANNSGLSNVVSKATTAASSNLLTQGDFQAGTAFTNATYTAGTSSDGVWYAGAWTNTANAGDAGSGDYAGKVNNNYSDLRLLQGVAAPANGTSMTLSFKYIRPSGMASYVRVYGLTSGQAIQPWAGGGLQGTQLFNYDLTNQSSWTSVNNQTFTVSGTFAKLVVYISVAGDATVCVDDFVLTGGGGGGGDTTAPSAVSNLSAPSSTSSSVTLNWTATGDDNSTGTASTYDIRRSTATITDANWASATAVTGEPTPAASGTGQSMTVSGLNASTTYYFAMKVSDEVPNTSGLSNVVSKATAAGGGTNLLTDGDFQSATAFTTGSYTAGTSSDGVWYSSTRWVKTANAGDGGAGDTAGTLTNNWSDLRLLQGVAAPASGTDMDLSFKYVQPGSGTCTIRVYGLTSGQVISNSAGGTLQGTELFTYNLATASSWTSVSGQSFTVSGTYAKLVVIISVGADAGIKADDVVLTQP